MSYVMPVCMWNVCSSTTASQVFNIQDIFKLKLCDKDVRMFEISELHMKASLNLYISVLTINQTPKYGFWK
jgi:hypothetical protein